MNDFTADELAWLLRVHEAVFDAVEKAETRLLVEVWGKDDQGPIAWIEVHPDDSDASIRFTPTSTRRPGWFCGHVGCESVEPHTHAGGADSDGGPR